ncbi:MAG: recombinase family protein, partial [Acidobacteria bacterium]|nr:recombinase family protein [Acidobacteriota bacterium]
MSGPYPPPTYTAIHHILTNPVYAGAYTYGNR